MFQLQDSTAFRLCDCSYNYHSPLSCAIVHLSRHSSLHELNLLKRSKRSKYLLQELPQSDFSVCCSLLPADKQKEWSQAHAAEYGAGLITDWASAWGTDAHASNSDIDYRKKPVSQGFSGFGQLRMVHVMLTDQIRPCAMAFPDSKLFNHDI